MKLSKTRLAVVDVPETLGAELRALLEKVASSPRERLGYFPLPANALNKQPLFGMVKHDWRNVAARYLRRHARKINPRIWIYRGGRHIAVHVAPDTRMPPWFQPKTFVPDACIGRIIETK